MGFKGDNSKKKETLYYVSRINRNFKKIKLDLSGILYTDYTGIYRPRNSK
jgi:hypothetical protein